MTEHLLAAMLPAVLVGLGSSYFMGQRWIAAATVRIDALERIVERLEVRDRGDRERLIRLETKVDILLGLSRDP